MKVFLPKILKGKEKPYKVDKDGNRGVLVQYNNVSKAYMIQSILTKMLQSYCQIWYPATF